MAFSPDNTLTDGPAAEFEDLHHASVIGATLSALTGNQAGVSVGQERLRQWSCVFRLRFVGESPASVLASVVRDDGQAAQGNNVQAAQDNNGPEDEDDESKIIDLTGDSDDKPDDEPGDSDDED